MELASAFADLEEDELTRKDAEIESLKLEYGDEVLKTIQLEHERKESLAVAEEWRKNAEQLREVIEVEQLRRLEAEQMEEDEVVEDLRRRLEDSNMELGDSYLAAARMQHDKRESMKLVEKWQREAEAFKLELAESDSKRRDDLEFEKRKSQLLTSSFRTEVTDLRALLGDGAADVPTTDDTGFVLAEEIYQSLAEPTPGGGDTIGATLGATMGATLGDSEIQTWKESFEKMTTDKRESLLLVQKWKEEADKYKGLLQNCAEHSDDRVDDMAAKLELERRQSAKEVTDLRKRIEDMEAELFVAKTRIGQLETEKLEMVMSTAHAVDTARDFVSLWSRSTARISPLRSSSDE